MNKLGPILLGIFLIFSAGTALAAYDFDDPALCVAGQWMVVDAAARSAVHVTVPEGTPFGNENQGGCDDPAPAKLLPASQVTAQGDGRVMVVNVDGAKASPEIKVTYGGTTKTAQNLGESYTFRFRLGK